MLLFSVREKDLPLEGETKVILIAQMRVDDSVLWNAEIAVRCLNYIKREE